jgi:hypothetical protein
MAKQPNVILDDNEHQALSKVKGKQWPRKIQSVN